MVDWSKQFQEATKNWTEVQEKTRERWAEATRSLSNSDVGPQWHQEAAKILDAWEESVKATTDFPVEQARMWAESLSHADAAPPQAREWAERLYSAARVMAGVQKQLVETWFASLRNLTPTEREGSWEKVIDTWREASQKAFEAQADWMRLWVTGPGEGARRETGKGESSSGRKT
jgi:hypothetical protein